MTWIVAPIALLVLLFGGLIWYVQSRTDTFRANCVTAEGHIYGSGLLLCLTDDGRVLEVYP